MRRGLFLHILVLFAFSGIGQQEMSFEKMEEYYDLIHDYYSQKKYALDVSYSSYKGHESTVPEDDMSGYVIKEGDVIESYQLGIYSIQDDEIKLLIDSSEQYVGLTYPDTTNTQGFNKEAFEQSKLRMEKMLLNYEGRDAVVQFIYKAGYEYQNVTMKISPNGLVKEMTLYFSSDLEYETASGDKAKDKAKVVVKSTPSSKKIKNEIESVIVKKSGEYALTSPFKSYELMDFRYQTN